MKHLLLLLFLSPTLLSAQQSTLHGKVAVFNSQFDSGKRQYVAGATVEEDYGKSQATLTRADGGFDLALVGVRDRANVYFSVKKTGMEVVNDDALRAVAGQKDTLRVFMAPTGKIAENKLRYYKINRATAERRLERKLDSLDRAMVALKTKNAVDLVRIADLQREMDRIMATLAGLDATISDVAERYSRVNLDDMSAAYQQAFRFFQQGELEAAIRVLEAADLEKQGDALAQERKALDQQKAQYATQNALLLERKKQSAEALLFKAELHALSLQTQEEEQCYLLLRKLYPEDLGYTTLHADFLRKLYRDKEALGLYQQILQKATAYAERRTAYHNLRAIYSAQGDKVAEEKILVSEKKDISTIPDSTEKWLAQIRNHEAFGDFFVDINLRESFDNMKVGTAIAERLARMDSTKYRSTLLSNYIFAFQAYKYSKVNWDYRDLYQRAKKYWQNCKRNDPALYQANERYFKESMWDILQETVSMGRESCPRCVKMLEKDLLENRKQETSTDGLLSRKSLLQNLGVMYYMQRDLDSADLYYAEALAIGTELRRKSPARFDLDYAEDLCKYVNYRSKTGRKSPDSLYDAIFEITDKYGHRVRAQGIEKEYFMPNFAERDAFLQKAMAEIEKQITALYFIDNGDSPADAYDVLREITAILGRYHAEKPNNRRIAQKLASYQGRLAWSLIHKKEFAEAEAAARRAIALDNSEKWIAGRLTIALLYQGRYDDALLICQENRNQYYYKESEMYIHQWNIAFCSELKRLPTPTKAIEQMMDTLKCGY
jgi:hypothetical protein